MRRRLFPGVLPGARIGDGKMTSPAPQRIIITGFMAAGKTTVAKALARHLSCQMIDLDRIITEREQRDIPALIRDEGEARFRQAETLALRVVLKNKMWRVIALGGGAWTLESNRALITEHNCVFRALLEKDHERRGYAPARAEAQERASTLRPASPALRACRAARLCR
jgi:shikimate kinase